MKKKYIAVDRNTGEVKAAAESICGLIASAPAECFITSYDSREYFGAWFAPGFWEKHTQ